jgi:hypothetical protein
VRKRHAIRIVLSEDGYGKKTEMVIDRGKISFIIADEQQVAGFCRLYQGGAGNGETF